MSTQFKIVVHCDEVVTPECHGLTEVSARRPVGDEHASPVLEARGWHRGYRADDTYDVCPACWPQVERRVSEFGRPVEGTPHRNRRRSVGAGPHPDLHRPSSDPHQTLTRGGGR